MHSRVWMYGVISVLAALAGAPASAQESKVASFQVEQYEPLPAQGTNLGNLARSEPLGHLAPSFGFTLHVVDDPIVVRRNEELYARLLDDQVKGELSAAVGFGGWVDMGLVMPIVLYQKGDLEALGGEEVSSFALADVRLIPRARVLKPEWAGGLGAAVLLPVYLPTGDTGSFNGDGGVRFEPRLAVDWSHAVGLTLVGNVGYQVRGRQAARNFVSDDLLRWGLGAIAPTGLDMLQATAQIFGAASFAQGRDPSDLTIVAPNRRAQPLEAQLGARVLLPSNILLHAGAGFGLSADVGSPDFRLLAGIEWTPHIDRDSDRDGVRNSQDKCPDDAEDRDGFEDEDGCPDFDNDGDGVLDGADGCPLEAEDRDGFQDRDGCPDRDNDGDGVNDDDDRCPDVPGPVEVLGCAPEDADADGVFDHLDRCPAASEDFDAYEDDDGCPDFDNDDDGHLDRADQCPLQPESYNGKRDDDGCPDTPASKIRLTADQIQPLEPVEFSGDRPTWRGGQVLQQVAVAVKTHALVRGVRIEVHTAATADADKLAAQKRAESVRDYLVKQGVGFDSLTPVAVIGAAPVDPGDASTAERVEFHLEVSEPPAVAPQTDDRSNEEEGGFDFSEGGE